MLHYTPLCGRAHILPPQQLLPCFSDVIAHLPSAQHCILPFESFDIIGQVLPSLPWQQLPLLQEEPSLAHPDPLPQQAVLPSAEPWLQQVQALALLSDGEGVLWVLWAIRAKAISNVLTRMRAFDFMVFLKILVDAN